MVITMGFYKLSHGKFHDRGYSDIHYGINSINIMDHNGNYRVLLPWLGGTYDYITRYNKPGQNDKFEVRHLKKKKKKNTGCSPNILHI